MHNFYKNMSIRSKFFVGMFLSSTVIIIILVSAISGFLYNQFLSLEASSVSSQMDYISGHIESLVASVDNYSKTIMTSETIQKASHNYKKTPDTDVYMSGDGIAVISELMHIIQSTEYIHSVTLYGYDQAYLISTESYPMPIDFNSISSNNHPQWISTYKKGKYDQSRILHALSYIRPFYSYSTGTFLGYLEITIPESSIADIYQSQAQDSHIIMVDQSGVIKSTSGYYPLRAFYEGFSDSIGLEKGNYLIADDSIVFSQYMPFLNWYIINELQMSAFYDPTMRIIVLCVLFGLVCILMFMLISQRLSRSITSPIQSFIGHTRKIEQEKIWAPIDTVTSDKDMKQLFSAFNAMITSLEKMKNDLLHSQQAKDKMALDLLQQQINPHFLYNTLDNICSLAELNENDDLITLVMNLSTFYRQILNSGKTFITLKGELDLTQAYLEILQIRYYDKFDYVIHCPEELYTHRCLKLLLQPIVENSIYHGIKNIDERGMIDIRVFEQDEGIKITVTDNGTGITPAILNEVWNTDSNHFGVRNIHQRIQLYYGPRYGLSLKNTEHGGCCVTIYIGKKEVE